MSELQTIESYTRVSGGRLRDLKFAGLLSLAGLGSGLVTLVLALIRPDFVFYFFGAPFGVIMGLVLAQKEVIRDWWRVAWLIALSSSAFIVAFWLTAGIEMWHRFGGTGKEPEVSPMSLFLGGLAGVFAVLNGTLLLVYPKMKVATAAWKSLVWSLFMGLAAIVGWALGPAFATQELGARPNPSQYVTERDHFDALFVVWQAVMGFILAMALHTNRTQARAEQG